MIEKSPIWTKSFVNISMSAFFIFTVFYALLTFVPLYVIEDLDGTVAEGGMATSVFLISAIIMRLSAGMILDKFGKKKVLVLSVFMFAVSTVLYIYVDNLGALLLLRFFHGIWFSLATTVAGAIAADIIPPKRRGEGLGYYTIAMNLAVVAGPFIALTLQPLVSAQLIFFIFSAIMIVGFLCALFVQVQNIPKKAAARRKWSISNFLEVKSVPISSVGFLISFAYASIITFISIYAEAIGLLQTAGLFFAVYAVSMLVVRPFTGRIFDSMGPDFVIIPSIIIFAIGLFTLSYTTTSWMLLLSGALIGLGYGTLLPSFQTLAIQATERHRSSYATGTFLALYESGIAIGAVALGVMVASIGYSNLYLTLAVFVLLTGVYYKWISMKTESSIRN